ncbi:hypothetical protein [Phenylobacterium terrae]|uniref:hypothetical protein n=1 Tax=Phenylobacterium terrae TaxID=2665495 RepID=UPI00366DEBE1
MAIAIGAAISAALLILATLIHYVYGPRTPLVVLGALLGIALLSARIPLEREWGRPRRNILLGAAAYGLVIGCSLWVVEDGWSPAVLLFGLGLSAILVFRAALWEVDWRTDERRAADEAAAAKAVELSSFPIRRERPPEALEGERPHL